MNRFAPCDPPAAVAKYLSATVLVTLLGWVVVKVPDPQPRRLDRAAQLLSRQPLSFEANVGQTDPRVKFLSRGPGAALFFTATESALTVGRAAVRMKLVGANPRPVVEGLEDLAARSNYYVGSDPSQWRAGVPHYAKVRYRAVYPGIDLIFYGNQGQLEYDFVVAPGADRAIRIAYEGAPRVRLTPDGDLELRAGGATVRHRRPVVYQLAAGQRRPIPARYQLAGSSEAAFRVGPYDPALPLVIDPVLAYSTYLGGSDGDGADREMGIAVDSGGNLVVAGKTSSAGFPTANAAQAAKSELGDAFVTKLNAAGHALVFSTFLGGTAGDEAIDVAVDRQDNVYVTGETSSDNFPTRSPLQPARSGNSDAFVAKLTPAGALLYSTYLGGGNNETGYAIAVDAAGAAYVAGATASDNFPTRNPVQATRRTTSSCTLRLRVGSFVITIRGIPCRTAFVAKLNPAGSALEYSTYLGGSQLVETDLSEGDLATAIAVDAAGNAYVGGRCISSDFPTTPGAFRTRYSGAMDGFVAKLNPAGSALLYSTYLGGFQIDLVNGLTVDAAGSVYAVGETSSNDFPTASPLQTALRGDADAFVTKLNPAGSALIYSTYLGGTDDETAFGVAVDRAGNAHLTGQTCSTDFPSMNPSQSAYGGACDAFVTKLNPAGSAFVYSTYLGGTRSESGWALALDAAGNAAVAGFTLSSNFPTMNPLRGTYGGDFGDAFIARLADAPVTPFVATVSAATFAPGGPVAPDSIVSAFGPGLSQVTAEATAIPLLTTLGGVSVRVTDSAGAERLAGLFFVSPGQINFWVPPQTAAGRATVTVLRGSEVLAAGTVQVEPTVPGLFTANSSGRGAPAALALRVAADGTRSAPSVFQLVAAGFVPAPIDLGPPTDQVYLLLFGTGIRGARSPVTATAGGQNVPVLGAVPHSVFVGLDQVNIGPLPRTLIGRGEIPLILTVEGRPANTVTVSIGGTLPGPDIAARLRDVFPKTPVLPSVNVPGDNVVADYTILNPTGASGVVSRTLYISTQPTFSMATARQVSAGTATLAGADLNPRTLPSPLPAGLSPGVHYIFLTVSFPGDPNPANDVSNALPVTLLAQRPPFDLGVELRSLTPLSVGPGDLIDVAYAITGANELSGTFTRSLYLSIDAVINTNDVLINTRFLDLFGGAATVLSTANRIPVDTAPGGYFVGVILQTEGDSNPANNVSTALPLQVVSQRAAFNIGAQLDNVSPGRVAPGGSFTINYTVRNTSRSVGIYNRSIYLSTDAVLTTADPLVNTRTVTLDGRESTEATSGEQRRPGHAGPRQLLPRRHPGEHR